MDDGYIVEIRRKECVCSFRGFSRQQGPYFRQQQQQQQQLKDQHHLHTHTRATKFKQRAPSAQGPTDIPAVDAKTCSLAVAQLRCV